MIEQPANPAWFIRLITPQPWMVDAACRDMGPGVFFPTAPKQLTHGSLFDRIYDDARAVCHRCPVVAECADYGSDERYGVWGGRTPAERSPRRVLAIPPAKCGTRGGYQRHQRAGEQPCPDCMHAQTQDAAWRKSQRKVTQ